MESHDIAFGVAAAFMFGIIGASLGWSIFACMGGLLIVEFFVLYLKRKFQLWKIALVFIVCVFCGSFYFHFRNVLAAREENIPFNRNVSFSGVITDEPLFSEKYQSFTVSLKPPFAGEVKVLTETSGIFNYGDALSVAGTIEPATRPAQNPTSFFPKVTTAAEHQGFWLREDLINFKKYLLAQFGATLPPDEAALMAGITFGSQSGFTKEFKNQMALSGTTHLVALSGYNISILVIAVGFLFGCFFSRRTSFYLTLISICLFVVMVGAQASIIRAAIMGFLVLLARESGRMYDMRNAITLAALLMALEDPTVLVYNIGFQLSFLSLLGIVYLEPIIKKILRVEDAGMFKSAAITTAAAQLAVFPLLSSTFGQFSPVAIVANTLILGFVPLTMLFGFLLAGLNAISSFLGFIIAKFSYLLLAYEIFVIRFFAAHAWPISFGGSLWPVMLYYAILLAAAYNIQTKSNRTI